MKIYHLCPSGSVWIFNQKQVNSREDGEAKFKKVSKPGDILKIDIPGQDTIKIYNLLKPNKTMGNKKSQVSIHAEDQKKDMIKEQEHYNKIAPIFFKKYTELTDEYGLFLNAQLEFSEDGIKPKIVVQIKPKLVSEKPKEETPNTEKKLESEPEQKSEPEPEPESEPKPEPIA